MVTASDDGTAGLGRRHQPTARAPLPHRGEVKHAAFRPDGQLVVTASDDGTARVWDAATSRPGPILKHGGTVYNARFSPDGRHVVTAGSDGTARVWDAATGLPLTAPMKHRDTILYAWFSPDGGRLLTISVGGDGTRIWPLDRPDLADRPVEDVMLHAQLLSGQTIDELGGSSPVEAATFAAPGSGSGRFTPRISASHRRRSSPGTGIRPRISRVRATSHRPWVISIN